MISGVAVIILSLIILSILPASAELAEGFFTPIIAFEFAQFESDLGFLSGDDQDSVANRQKMDEAHQWDMIFPVAYGFFLAFILLGQVSDGYQIAWLGVPFALLAIPFDILENLALIDITTALNQNLFSTELLNSLYLRTWLKWGSIALAIFTIAIVAIQKKEYLSGAVGIAVALLAGIGFLSGSVPIFVELMSLSVSIFFILFIVKTSVQFWKSR